MGGGLGGCAAALAAARMGKRVVLTEEGDWLGGQLTAQAVPPDEHPWIEQMGCTPGYRRLRDGVRGYHRRNYPLIPAVRDDPFLNPGQGEVSSLCHEPRVALAAMEEMLQSYRSADALGVLLRHQAVAAEVDGDRVRSVLVTDLETGDQTVLHSPFVIDATELGDLLELDGVEHVIGSESRDQAGEQHAVPGPPPPLDQQAISWCHAVDYRSDQDHTSERPEDYAFWHPETPERRYRPIFDRPTGRPHADDLWHFRRILYRGHYPAGQFDSDISVVNWPRIDYWLGPLLGVSEEDRQVNLLDVTLLGKQSPDSGKCTYN